MGGGGKNRRNQPFPTSFPTNTSFVPPMTPVRISLSEKATAVVTFPREKLRLRERSE